MIYNKKLRKHFYLRWLMHLEWMHVAIAIVSFNPVHHFSRSPILVIVMLGFAVLILLALK